MAFLKTSRRLSAALLATAVLFAAGCAAPVTLLPLALPAIISGAGSGISYTFTNVAFKTMTFPLEDVEAANLKALNKMSIEVKKVKHGKYSTKIISRTRKHKIKITIERMTPTLTMIRVNAKKGLFLKDKTTAFEVIYQTERFLLDLEPEKLASIAPPGKPGAGSSLNRPR